MNLFKTTLKLTLFLFLISEISACTSTAPAESLSASDPASSDSAVVDAEVTTSEDTPVSVTLAAQDNSGNALSYEITSTPTHGSVSILDNVATYFPAANYFGTDQLTYSAANGSASASAIITITITAVNDAPVAEDTSFFIVSVEGSTPFSVSATDVDGDELTYSFDSTQATISGSEYSYTPLSSFAGETFHYTVSDGTLSDTGTVTVALATTTGSTDSTSSGSETSGTISGTSDGSAADTSSSSGSSDGESVGTTTGSTDSGSSGSETSGTTSGTSGGSSDSTSGSGGNTAPAAGSQTITLQEDNMAWFELSGSDTDGDSIIYEILSEPSHGGYGTFSSGGVLSGEMTYTPSENYHGEDSFTFRVVDSQGLASEPATILFIITDDGNDAPVVQNLNYSVTEGESVLITFAATDPNGDAIAGYGITQYPFFGTLLEYGTTAVYTPAGDFNGTDFFSYTATDSYGLSTTSYLAAYVGINVLDDGTDSDENAAPVVSDLETSTDEDQSVDITLSATDANDDPLIYSIAYEPAFGTTEIDGTVVSYTPDADYNGNDRFGYRVSDGTTSVVAYATITINAVDDEPAAATINLAVTAGSIDTIDLAIKDADDESLSYTFDSPLVETTEGGQNIFNATSTPEGLQTVNYTVSDGHTTKSGIINVTVQVICADDADDDHRAEHGCDVIETE